MDEQEFFNKIKELQKQRDLLKKDVTVLECKINELRNSSEGNYLGMMSQQNLKRIKQNNYGCYFINYNDFDSSYLCGSCYSKYCFSSYVFHRRV